MTFWQCDLPNLQSAILHRVRAVCMDSVWNVWGSVKTSGKPSGPDPKHTQAFNKPTVHKHFDLLLKIICKYDIPIENVYNMDEKGCQRGGGCKNSNQKYFIHRSHWPKYRVHSGNLKLVTIIECVCADGTYLLPGFVFSGKEFAQEWFEVDSGIG